MARKGRQLEQLIEKLEKIVLPNGASIQSPGFVPDRITGQPREVDILIEYTLGTSPIKIIIECRDRDSVQDVTWIEQIHTKVNDLKVNKVIAVSSSQFTQPAKDKAKFYGIEARTYSEIDYEVIKSWWLVEFLDVVTRQYQIIGAHLETEHPDIIKGYLTSKTPIQKFINRTTDDQTFSLDELFSGIADSIPDWSSLPINGAPIRKKIVVNYPNNNDRFLIKTDKGEIPILNITFVVDLAMISRQIPISKIAKYSDDEKSISHVIEYNVADTGDIQILQLIKNPDGSISMSTRKKDRD